MTSIVDQLVDQLQLTTSTAPTSGAAAGLPAPGIRYRGGMHDTCESGYGFAFGVCAALGIRFHPDTPDWPERVVAMVRLEDGRPATVTYTEGDVDLAVHATDHDAHAWAFWPEDAPDELYATRWTLDGTV